MAKDIWAWYGGTLFALNGDFTRNGLVARAFGYYADFDYRADSTEFDGKDRALDVMLGYLYYMGHVSATGYVGMEVRDVNIEPDDATNKVRGTETGFKVALEVETDDETPWYVAADGSYSTAFNSWYGMLRTGYNMQNAIYSHRAIFGPEAEIYGDEGEVTWRLGGFVTVPFNLTPSMPSEISFAVGHQFVEDADRRQQRDRRHDRCTRWRRRLLQLDAEDHVLKPRRITDPSAQIGRAVMFTAPFSFLTSRCRGWPSAPSRSAYRRQHPGHGALDGCEVFFGQRSLERAERFLEPVATAAPITGTMSSPCAATHADGCLSDADTARLCHAAQCFDERQVGVHVLGLEARAMGAEIAALEGPSASGRYTMRPREEHAVRR